MSHSEFETLSGSDRTDSPSVAYGLPDKRLARNLRTALSDNHGRMSETTQKLRVLVVDDGADNAEALCALLGVMGCTTAVAFSGADGIAEAARFKPHLALIDLEMPGMGGCELAELLRASHPTTAMRLICLTGRGQPDDRRTCIDAGFDDFFTKPMPLERLVEVVAASKTALP